ncbi:glucokinase [Phaeovibrio sulfidiphilus]|uniref:Glucokinase n=1 Tax=Phaeovibrio sulfidiphilus TaxID=1220600 RepID=A0A8J6YUY5_9PROT|nr:glucokinase [Phaeovibrio sulfidiphilus]MBE1236222.1 glucokinase [Phaeovibrio sulfidiphilus]
MAGLIADIGATNARFALTTPEGGWTHRRVYSCADFSAFADAIRAYYRDVLPPGAPAPTAAAVALPGPVVGDTIHLTNLGHWTFSIRDMAAEFGFEPFLVVNDFQANALAVRHLGADDCLDLGGGAPKSGAPIAVIGPGTGLGVSLLLPSGETVATEGGHVTLPVTTAREVRVAQALAGRFGHAAAERAVSGPGLVNLAHAVREIDGLAPVPDETPQQVMTDGLAGTCPVRAEAVSLFHAFLGAVCGNLVLTTGALGGLWLMGGILPRNPQALAGSLFPERYAAKGRFRPYLEGVPRRLVTHPHPAFVGLGRLLEAARQGTPLPRKQAGQ